MKEGCPEISFYLSRGDYYQYISFNDSVYRLYKELLRHPDVLPDFDQIVIDEYQDFNPLEVAFIDELEKKGPILIVGDDDQAVYSGKHSSPKYIRDKYISGLYEIHELPFCSRCPNVIVNAINGLIGNAVRSGYLLSRIEKRFIPFLNVDDPLNLRYPRLTYVEVPVLPTIVNYIRYEVSLLTEDEITNSYSNNYPTVLIIGQSQYITQIHKRLKEYYDNIDLKVSDSKKYDITDGLAVLLDSPRNNLGWRILLEFVLPPLEFTDLINRSGDGTDIIEILDENLMRRYTDSLELIRVLTQGTKTDSIIHRLEEIYGDNVSKIVSRFWTEEEVEEEDEINDLSTRSPKILLTTFEGCKGLSGGRVFIVGFHDGSMPKLTNGIVEDIEFSKLIVAITRTRLKCDLIYNKWFIKPEGNQTKNRRSSFLRFIPTEYLENIGEISSKTIARWVSKGQ